MKKAAIIFFAIGFATVITAMNEPEQAAQPAKREDRSKNPLVPQLSKDLIQAAAALCIQEESEAQKEEEQIYLKYVIKRGGVIQSPSDESEWRRAFAEFAHGKDHKTLISEIDKIAEKPLRSRSNSIKGLAVKSDERFQEAQMLGGGRLRRSSDTGSPLLQRLSARGEKPRSSFDSPRISKSFESQNT